MGESIAILIIFFFLLMFGFAFYTKIQKISYEDQKRVLLELSIIKLSQRAAFMSEFQCSFKDISVDNCYDYYKLRAFEGIIDSEQDVMDYYSNMFGQSEINIKEIYPGNSNYILYSNPLPEKDSKFIERLGFPISIYNATSKSFSIGILNITIYSK